MASKKAEHGMKGILTQLFGQELVDLVEDESDDSKEECHIFEEIFYEAAAEEGKTDGNNHTKSSASINCRDSSMEDAWGEVNESTGLNLKEASTFESFQESCSSCAGSSAHNAKPLQAKLSPTRHLDRQMEDSEHIYHLDTCAALACLNLSEEASNVATKDPPNETVLSTLHLDLEKGSEHTYPDTTSGDVDLNHNCKIQHVEDGKVVVDSKPATSPVSHESVASRLLETSDPLAPEKTSSAITCTKQSAEFIESDIVNASVILKRPLKRDLPCRLESHAHHLLIDAGWTIKDRKRHDRTRPAYFFVNKVLGIANKALTVAWRACGKGLLASAAESERNENGREWWDVDSFWREMKDTMDLIDNEVREQESSWSLLQRWQLLDPFMAVVWIDRKLSTLRAGKGLKAVKSTTFILDERTRPILAETGMNGADENIKSSKKRLGKGLNNVKCPHMGSTGLKSKRKRSNWETSNSTETQNLSGLGETPSSGVKYNCGQINILPVMGCSADQANTLIIDTVPQEFSSLHQEGAIIAGNVSGSETKVREKRTAVAAASADGSVKKSRKKSKKISEIGGSEVTSKDVQAKPLDDNCREDISLSMDEKNNEQLDLVIHQKETNILISELSSECLQQVELSEKQTSSAQHTPIIEAMNVPSKIKISKRREKSEAKAARKSGKKKGKNSNLEDEQGHPLLGEGMEHQKSTRSECKAKRPSSNESDSMSSKKKKVAPDFDMVCDKFADPNISVVADSGNVPRVSGDENICDEVLSTTSGLSSGPESNQKLVKATDSGVNKRKGQRKFKKCRINDDDLLIAAVIKTKDFGSRAKKLSPKVEASQLKALRKLTSQKGSCRLFPRALKKGGNHSVDERRKISLGTRTVLCWLIEMGTVSLKDVVQCRNPKNNDVWKDGWVTREGILCKCCTQVFSVSGFKTHAGLKQQSPHLNLLLHTGKPYFLCQLQAWSAEFKRKKIDLRTIGTDEKDGSDDTCGICGDGGDLICCDNCPSTYHQTCLSAQELPEGNWYCPNCICVACRDVVTGKETSSSLAVLECHQCEHKYHGACVTENGTCNGEIGTFAWFCGESCQEVYMGLHSRLGVVNAIGDGFSWTILRCSHDVKKVLSPQKIALMAESNTKLAVALNLMEECFLPMVDPRTGIDMIPHVLYNLGSPFARLNYQGFYTVILEKGDQLISAASIRVHGTTVAEMPLIATCSDYRRQGMCRRLLNGIEQMLISFKVKILVISAIPSLVETWSSGFGFKPIEDEDKHQLSSANLVLFPGTVFLKKNLHVDLSVRESVEHTDMCSKEQQTFICGDLIESADAETTQVEQVTEDNASDAITAERNVPFDGKEVAEKVSVDDHRDKNDVILSDKGGHDYTMNMDPNTSQNVNTLTESCTVDTIENDRENLVDSSEGNGGCCVLDEVVNANLAAKDLNEMNLEGIDNV